MKYIDAEKLKAEIDKLESFSCISEEQDGFYSAISRINDIIDSLQQEQPELPEKDIAKYYYHKGVYEGLSQGRADALKILDEFAKSKADPVVIIKQQEQPEVDLEKEIEDFLHKTGAPYFWTNDSDQLEWCCTIARHFYELGLNATKFDKQKDSIMDSLLSILSLWGKEIQEQIIELLKIQLKAEG